MVGKNLYIVYEPSGWYRFDGSRGVSDIDVMLMDQKSDRVFSARWAAKAAWG